MTYIEHEIFEDHVEIGSDTVVQFCTFKYGLSIRGDNNLVRHNIIEDADTGISIFGEMNTVMMNHIWSFSVDGIRVLNSYNAVTDNVIEGSYEVNPDNHNDGIQIFPYWNNEDTEIHGINISRNKLYLSQSKVSTQGIIATDCIVTDSVFAHNLVDVNHWHGITLNESENCDISWNIITNTYGGSERVPWVKLRNDLGGSLVQENTTPAIVAVADHSDNRLVDVKIG